MLRNRPLLFFITFVHRFLYVASGGAIGGRVLWIRMLLLINTGRRTGQERKTPLLYVEDGDRWVVVASNAGSARHPAWWYNLSSHPRARIQVGTEEVEVTWRQATEDECETLWPKLVQSYRFYPEYRKRLRREIPVVVLERAA
ncbi:MAG: nitroreductase family deazaflavin-dependent oxidoreductase [Deltaproteobacteria bacterium]|nr:nitroreductase family deazaflavin-dependent oxidoreductase [Deltaproteobacteria bacterium]MBW2400128.1 nitroreductase family deazaflavin-dependent oxidoreductase [Deltaproteobacteria bacterium]